MASLKVVMSELRATEKRVTIAKILKRVDDSIVRKPNEWMASAGFLRGKEVKAERDCDGVGDGGDR